MTVTLDFKALLEAAGKGEVEKLEDKKATLEEDRGNLQAELSEVQTQLVKVERELLAHIKAATSAARQLGVEVPEEYQNRQASTKGGGRQGGKFRWESNGLMPKQEGVSRAMWRLSKGSGGSAGREGQEVLTVDEFWALVESQTGQTEEEIKLGEKVKVDLPNGREVVVQKVED